MNLFNYNLDLSHRTLSHELSEFGRYLFDKRSDGGTILEDSILGLSEVIDESLETEEEMSKYGINTEIDASDFCSEVFGRFYEESPEVVKSEWTDVQNAIAELPEYQALKSSVAKDADLSAMAASHTLNLFKDEIADLLKESRSYREKEKEDKKRPPGDNPGDNPGLPNGPSPDGPSPDGPSAEDPSDQESVPFEVSKEMKERLMAKAVDIEKITEEMRDLKGTIAAAGNMTSNVNGTDEDRSELTKQLVNNSGLRYLFKMMGRLKALMNSLPAHEFNEEQREQIVTVGRGQYTDLLQSEQLLLADDFTTDIFLDRWIRRSQLKWRKRGKTKVGGGPIILLLDESSSMGTRRTQMASAFASAMATLATDEKRGFYSFGFNRQITHKASITKNGVGYVGSAIRSNKSKPIEVVMFLMNRGCNGGTHFDPPLQRGIEVSKVEKKADIILLTDGAAPISNSVVEDLKKQKKENGLRVFTILVGGAATNAVSRISDGVAHVSDLNDTSSLVELASLMKKTMTR